MKRTQAPVVSEFPEPNTWATWRLDRTPQFKTHRTAGQAKNALTLVFRSNGASHPAWVYEWVSDEYGERWVERWHIAVGDRKDGHPLYAQRISNKPKEVSAKAVDAAIASIVLEAQRKEADA